MENTHNALISLYESAPETSTNKTFDVTEYLSPKVLNHIKEQHLKLNAEESLQLTEWLNGLITEHGKDANNILLRKLK